MTIWTWKGFVILLGLVLFACTSKEFRLPVMQIEKQKGEISILSANIGNMELGCRDYIYKPCYIDVENRLAKNIAALSPDIVSLQEVLAPWQCAGINEKDPRKICFQEHTEPQIRRLLGPEYSIVCSNRNQYECVAIKTSLGRFVDCEIGGLCNEGRTTLEVVGCDNGFNAMAATIRLNTGEEFDVLNVHLESTSRSCRVNLLQQIFGDGVSFTDLLHSERVLIAGDFNFDPWRDDEADTQLWKSIMEHGWMDRPLQYHSGLPEHDPPYITSSFILKRSTVDFIASNFLAGTCNVLGGSPGTDRLDGGSGMDHRAIFGFLTSETGK